MNQHYSEIWQKHPKFAAYDERTCVLMQSTPTGKIYRILTPDEVSKLSDPQRAGHDRLILACNACHLYQSCEIGAGTTPEEIALLIMAEVVPSRNLQNYRSPGV